MSQKYRVVISGHTLSGQALSTVREDVGLAFGLQGQQLDRLLSGRPAAVARSLDETAADAMLRQLHALDLEAVKQALPPAEAAPAAPQSTAQTAVPAAPPSLAQAPGALSEELFALTPNAPSPPVEAGKIAPGSDETVCPQCGELQPKRTLCRQCGLDMPRFMAAQEEARREAAERKAAAVTAKPSASEATGDDDDDRLEDAPRSRLLGIDFGGRLGRIAYLLSMFVATLIFLVFLGIAVVTEKKALMQLGILLSTIFSIRCVVLRLHDTGRNGWLCLISLVPIVNLLMFFALLLVPGDDGDNDYGPPPDDTSLAAFLLTVVVTLALGSAIWRHMGKTPENLVRYLAMLQTVSPAPPASVGGDDEETAKNAADSPPSAHYAAHNQVDIYVIAQCERCEEVNDWLNGKGLKPTVHWLDRDNGANERLHQRLGGGNQEVQLPVVEVNGTLLADNPSLNDIHRHLKQE